MSALDPPLTLPTPSAAPPGAPDLVEAQRCFAAFCVTVAALRDPKSGCPWDLLQDHHSLRRFMIEEAYEAADAMAGADAREICGELGDVLLQVVLNAQVAHDAHRFGIADVIAGIDAKMRRRHPHVFPPEGAAAAVPVAPGEPGISVAEVHSAWAAIKAAEKAAAGRPADSRLMAEAEKVHPSTLQALKIGKLAKRVQFDWETPAEVLAQVRSEVDEVAAELARPQLDKAKVAEELGDVYFSLAQLCRHLDVDPELVAIDGNRKFLRRFGQLERLAAAEGVDVAQASRRQLEDFWTRVKAQE